MLLEFALFGLAVAGFLFFFGWFFTHDDNRRFHLIIAGSFVLIITGLFLAMDSGLGVPSDCINATYESSHVWNCSNYTAVDCFGKPTLWSCMAYNETQCRDIDGCTYTVQGCTGTPEWTCEQLWDYGGEEKCLETDGCYIWNQTNPHTCDSYDTTYTYGPCYENTMDFNFSLLISIVLMLAGVGTAAAALSWLRTTEE